MNEIMTLLKWIYSTWENLPDAKRGDFISHIRQAVKDYLT